MLQAYSGQAWGAEGAHMLAPSSFPLVCLKDTISSLPSLPFMVRDSNPREATWCPKFILGRLGVQKVHIC